MILLQNVKSEIQLLYLQRERQNKNGYICFRNDKERSFIIESYFIVVSVSKSSVNVDAYTYTQLYSLNYTHFLTNRRQYTMDSCRFWLNMEVIFIWSIFKLNYYVPFSQLQHTFKIFHKCIPWIFLRVLRVGFFSITSMQMIILH